MKQKIIIKKISNDKQSSFWYKGSGDIALLSKEEKEIIISVTGDIRVKFNNENFYRKNNQAVYIAFEKGLNDEDLEKLNFDENNWFDFVYRKSKSEWIEIDGDETFFYNDAILSAENYLNDNEFWGQL